MIEPEVLEWLLDSDPALRWQVERDLAGADEGVWQATKARVATEGFGARLVALQDPDGQWAGGAYFPGDFDFAAAKAAQEPGQPWTATTWSLNALREWGLDASVLGDTGKRLAANSRWEYDDLPYWGGEVDCCINAFTLANGAWLGIDVAPLVDWFVEHPTRVLEWWDATRAPGGCALETDACTPPGTPGRWRVELRGGIPRRCGEGSTAC